MDNEQTIVRPAERRLNQARKLAERTAKTARRTVEGRMSSGLRMVRARARRRDLFGEATYRALSLVHDGAGVAARSLGRLEEATQPPTRTVHRRTSGSKPDGGARRAAAASSRHAS